MYFIFKMMYFFLVCCYFLCFTWNGVFWIKIGTIFISSEASHIRRLVAGGGGGAWWMAGIRFSLHLYMNKFHIPLFGLCAYRLKLNNLFFCIWYFIILWKGGSKNVIKCLLNCALEWNDCFYENLMRFCYFCFNFLIIYMFAYTFM